MPINDRTFVGIVVNGQIRVPLGIHLPDNATVLITVAEELLPTSGSVHTPHLVHPDDAIDFEMKVEKARQ